MVVDFPADAKLVRGISNLPVCGVVATAVLTGKSFTECYNYYKTMHTSRWRGALRRSLIFNTLRKFGCTLTKRHNEWKGQPTWKFISWSRMVNENKVFFICNNNHVFVVVGDHVIDQGGKVHFMQYHWRRKKIEEIYEVRNENIYSAIPEVNHKEIMEMNERSMTKFARATNIVQKMLEEGAARKEILATLSKDLDTTWGCASTFYHRIKRTMKEKESA